MIDLTVSGFQSEDGFVVHGKLEITQPSFNGLAIFDVQRMDGHYAIFDPQRRLIGIEDLDNLEKTLLRSRRAAINYAQAIADACEAGTVRVVYAEQPIRRAEQIRARELELV